MRPAPAPKPSTRVDDAAALAPDAIRSLRGSKIREIANAGMHDPDVLAFWFGEPDLVTPQFIRDAATASLARGETFYAQNFGIPELREAIAGYVTRLHGTSLTENVAVTASGMSALMLAVQALVAPGDRVVVVTPLWPNLVEIPKILRADVVCVPLVVGCGGVAREPARARRVRPAGVRLRRMDARPRSPARGARAGHTRAADQLAEQSHRMDDRRGGAARNHRALRAARALDHRPTP